MFDFYDDIFSHGFGGGGSRYTFADGDVDRRSFARVSDRAMRAQDDVSYRVKNPFWRV